jgi:uncharacterized protein YjcR
MSKSNKNEKNYFDKFIDDQIRRSEQIKERKEKHTVADDVDLKRRLLRRYRENVSHLIRRKTKNG